MQQEILYSIIQKEYSGMVITIFLGIFIKPYSGKDYLIMNSSKATERGKSPQPPYKQYANCRNDTYNNPLIVHKNKSSILHQGCMKH